LLVNTTQGFRWSFDIWFNKSGDPTGRSHFPDFVVRSQEHPSLELHDWQRWRTLWEEARARLSAKPHIPIHRWDNSGPYCA
jgi:phytanoyl-CoA hydroxylase